MIQRPVALSLLMLVFLVPVNTSASAAWPVDSIRVLSGDRLAGRLDGREVIFEVAGIWCPAPAGTRVPGYRGEEARKRARRFLEAGPIELRLSAPPNGRRRVRARVLVGGEDLAVELAAAGLAIVDRASAVDEAQAEAIRTAESRARRERLGMHDGGYARHARDSRRMRDLGVEVWSVFQLGGGAPSADRSGNDGEAAAKAWWSEPSAAREEPLIVPGVKLTLPKEIGGGRPKQRGSKPQRSPVRR